MLPAIGIVFAQGKPFDEALRLLRPILLDAFDLGVGQRRRVVDHHLKAGKKIVVVLVVLVVSRLCQRELRQRGKEALPVGHVHARREPRQHGERLRRRTMPGRDVVLGQADDLRRDVAHGKRHRTGAVRIEGRQQLAYVGLGKRTRQRRLDQDRAVLGIHGGDDCELDALDLWTSTDQQEHAVAVALAATQAPRLGRSESAAPSRKRRRFGATLVDDALDRAARLEGHQRHRHHPHHVQRRHAHGRRRQPRDDGIRERRSLRRSRSVGRDQVADHLLQLPRPLGVREPVEELGKPSIEQSLQRCVLPGHDETLPTWTARRNRRRGPGRSVLRSDRSSRDRGTKGCRQERDRAPHRRHQRQNDARETMMIIRSPIALNDWPGQTQPKSGGTHRRQTALTHPESPVIAERGPMQWGISDRKRGSPTYDVPARGHVHPSGWPTHGDETGSVFARRRPGARPTTSDFANPDPRRSFHARPGYATPKIAIRLASERPIVSFQVRLATHIWHRSVEICNTFVDDSSTSYAATRQAVCGQGLWAARATLGALGAGPGPDWKALPGGKSSAQNPLSSSP